MRQRKTTLHKIKHPKINKRLLNMLHSKHAKTRQKAVEKLASIKSAQAFNLLVRSLDDVDHNVRNSAVSILGYLGDSRAVDPLIALFHATEQVEAIQVVSAGGKSQEEIVLIERHKVSACSLIEALGRIGHPRALPLLTRKAIEGHEDFSAYTVKLNIQLSWAIASIAPYTEDLAIKRQAALQLIEVFPVDSSSNRHILHRLPWRESDMLNTVAELLGDPDTEVQLQAAMFLSVHGDSRGSDLLLERIRHPESSAVDRHFGEYIAVLTELGDRRLVDTYLQLLTQSDLARNVAQEFFVVMGKWANTLTSDQLRQLETLAPRFVMHLVRGEVDPYLVSGIRRIQSEKANRLLDEWLEEEIYTLFKSFIDHGDPIGVPDNLVDLKLISRARFAADHGASDAGILTHPLMRRYAFPALSARFKYIRTNEANSFNQDTLIALMGWLGDPQALPFLEEELANCTQKEISRTDTKTPGRDLFGEIIYAIANIGSVESVPLLLGYLQHPKQYFRTEVIKPLRDFVRRVPDKLIIDALVDHLMSEDEFLGPEIIEAIGQCGAPVAVPALSRFLSRRDEECVEAISALATIARESHVNQALVSEIVGVFTPLLTDKQKVRLPFRFYPVETMPLDEFTVLNLRYIHSSEALLHVEQWLSRNAAQ
jgi:HEAT repeat protein